MNIEIKECKRCKGSNLHRVQDGFIICLDCNYYCDIEWNEMDKMSMWIYKREILKQIKQKGSDGKIKESAK